MPVSTESIAEPLPLPGESFDPQLFEQLAALEQKNFWFRARNRLIIWAIRSQIPSCTSFLEIGCGTGFVLEAIKKSFPKAAITGTELFPHALTFAQARVPEASLVAADAKALSLKMKYEAAGAFDVLEHIDDDLLVLRQLHKVLAPSGYLFLTVPQHRFLWSPSDELACHQRRYQPGELEDKLLQTGFRVLRSSSFMFFLLPLMFLSRFFQRKLKIKKFNVMSELQIPAIASGIFEAVLSLEIWLIKLGVDLPAGGSRLVIAQAEPGLQTGEKL